MEHEFPESRHREYTRVINREVDRLQNLVNRMLGPNRAPQKSLLNINELPEHVRRLVQAEAPAEVTLLRDYDPRIPEITIEREKIIHAVLNVRPNKLQHVGSAGHTIFSTRPRRQVPRGGR